MNLWAFIGERLCAGIPVQLLWVVSSEGSSPGRKGFRMAVSADGALYGTIGGGIMEHKLVELARSRFPEMPFPPILIRQFHDTTHAQERSGMICSGSQVIALVPLHHAMLHFIDGIVAGQAGFARFGPSGFQVLSAATPSFRYVDETDWDYTEAIDQRHLIHIIGGGHVSLALSELLSYLGFDITVYDNRPGLNTLEQNKFAKEKVLVDYGSLGSHILGGPNEGLVIMTVGYRDDKLAFRQLFDKPVFYAGMMGSEQKIATLLRELQDEGLDPATWKHWFMPIGLPIFSKTTQEIAVSIAAQVIREKNKDLSTGRTKTELMP
ncbi:MAG: XdhC/CoxI family protein [Flaviaesturariibacter sp.]|nr:XdhC/CoxI family protein [Flaviaesturariibacter sp.]